MNSSIKFAVISSTGGSVVKTVFANAREQNFNLDLIVCDRICGMSAFAEETGIPLVFVDWKDGIYGSDQLMSILEAHGIDFVYLFFSRLLRGAILQRYANRIINFHPSLLPACPGLFGFADTVKSGSILAGSTVHFVDEGMDTGRQIMQAFTIAAGVDRKVLRHTIFAQQCASLFYVHKMLKRGINLATINTKESQAGQGFVPNIDAESLQLFERILKGNAPSDTISGSQKQ